MSPAPRGNEKSLPSRRARRRGSGASSSVTIIRRPLLDSKPDWGRPGGLAICADGCGGNRFCLSPKGVNDPLEACKQRGHDLAREVVKIALRTAGRDHGAHRKQLESGRPAACRTGPRERRPRLGGRAERRPRHRIPVLSRPEATTQLAPGCSSRPFPTKSSDYTCTDDARRTRVLRKSGPARLCASPSHQDTVERSRGQSGAKSQDRYCLAMGTSVE